MKLSNWLALTINRYGEKQFFQTRLDLGGMFGAAYRNRNAIERMFGRLSSPSSI